MRRNEKGELSISEFTDELATSSEIAVGVSKICASFPRMEPEFWNILAERIRANRFTSERLRQAVEFVLDNFQYKELNISDIIKFDRRVKLYTAGEFAYAQTTGIDPSEFEKREIDGVMYRVLKADLTKAGLR
jgi:hypothetical protein